MEFLVFHFVPIVPSLGTTKKSLAPPPSLLPIRYLYTVKIVHIFLHVGYQPWAHPCYWLLISETVHITKLLLLESYFMAVITKNCGSRVTFCRSFLLGFFPWNSQVIWISFVIFNTKCMRGDKIISYWEWKSEVCLSYLLQNVFICQISFASEILKMKDFGNVLIITFYSTKKKSIQLIIHFKDYYSIRWNQVTFTTAENPQKWWDKWRLQWPKQSPKQLFWGLPSYANDTICYAGVMRKMQERYLGDTRVSFLSILR